MCPLYLRAEPVLEDARQLPALPVRKLDEPVDLLEVDITWRDGKLSKARIKSLLGQPCRIAWPDAELQGRRSNIRVNIRNCESEEARRFIFAEATPPPRQ